MSEPEIIINGIKLTYAQAMTLRVAISGFDSYCGDDEHGKFMTAAYKKSKTEICNIMVKGVMVEGMSCIIQQI